MFEIKQYKKAAFLNLFFSIYLLIASSSYATSGSLAFENVVENLKKIHIRVFSDGKIQYEEKKIYADAIISVRNYLSSIKDQNEKEDAIQILQGSINDLRTYENNGEDETFIRTNVGYLIGQLFPQEAVRINGDDKTIYTKNPNVILRDEIAESLNMDKLGKDQLLEAINDTLITVEEMKQIPALVNQIDGYGMVFTENQPLLEKMQPISTAVYNFMERSAKNRIHNLFDPLVSSGQMSKDVAQKYYSLSYVELLYLEKNYVVARLYSETLDDVKRKLPEYIWPTSDKFPVIILDEGSFFTEGISKLVLQHILKGVPIADGIHFVMKAEMNTIERYTKDSQAFKNAQQMAGNILARLIPGMNIMLDGWNQEAILADTASVVTVFSLGLGSFAKAGQIGLTGMRVAKGAFVVDSAFALYFAGQTVLGAQDAFVHGNNKKGAVYAALAVFCAVGARSSFKASKSIVGTQISEVNSANELINKMDRIDNNSAKLNTNDGSEAFANNSKKNVNEDNSTLAAKAGEETKVKLKDNLKIDRSYITPFFNRIRNLSIRDSRLGWNAIIKHSPTLNAIDNFISPATQSLFFRNKMPKELEAGLAHSESSLGKLIQNKGIPLNSFAMNFIIDFEQRFRVSVELLNRAHKEKFGKALLSKKEYFSSLLKELENSLSELSLVDPLTNKVFNARELKTLEVEDLISVSQEIGTYDKLLSLKIPEEQFRKGFLSSIVKSNDIHAQLKRTGNYITQLLKNVKVGISLAPLQLTSAIRFGNHEFYGAWGFYREVSRKGFDRLAKTGGKMDVVFNLSNEKKKKIALTLDRQHQELDNFYPLSDACDRRFNVCGTYPNFFFIRHGVPIISPLYLTPETGMISLAIQKMLRVPLIKEFRGKGLVTPRALIVVPYVMIHIYGGALAEMDVHSLIIDNVKGTMSLFNDDTGEEIPIPSNSVQQAVELSEVDISAKYDVDLPPLDYSHVSKSALDSYMDFLDIFELEVLKNEQLAIKTLLKLRPIPSFGYYYSDDG